MMAIKSVQRVHPNTHCSDINKSKGLQRVDTEGALGAMRGSLRLYGWVGEWAFIPCWKAAPS